MALIDHAERFDGALISAPIIYLSGTLTVDLSNYQGFEGIIALFQGQLEGDFADLNVIGLECVSATLEQGDLFVLHTCTDDASRPCALGPL